MGEVHFIPSLPSPQKSTLETAHAKLPYTKRIYLASVHLKTLHATTEKAAPVAPYVIAFLAILTGFSSIFLVLNCQPVAILG